MDTILLIIAIIMVLAGVAGSFLPILPGPPISFFALIVLNFTKYAHLNTNLLIVLGALTLFSLIADFLIPTWSTGKFGGSKYGKRGAFVGTIVGLFFGPLGIVIGPFAGAIVGELLGGKSGDKAFKSGIGSFIGFIFGTGIKLILSLVILFYFFRALI